MQLTIYEHHGAERVDITSTYQASFFLFTTLENARTINNGRVPLNNNTFPALTGMPCAGMAYLERPSPGGYFIFPDLSVRHEGKYLLSFNLYEDTKASCNDDLEPSGPALPNPSPITSGSSGPPPQKQFRFRMEMKSMPFQVFSAKKFPGLAESTQLSRVVAEQGCRVRIRRDVRMRRRETGKDFPDYEEEHQHIRPDTSYTGYSSERARSVSNSSVHSAITASAPGYPQGRRPSQDNGYIDQNAYQAPTAMPTSGTSAPYTDHLVFGGTSYGTGAFQPPPAPINRSMHHYSSPGNAPYSSTTHIRHMSNPQDYAYSNTVQQQSPYQQNLSRHSSIGDFTPMHNGQVTSQPMYQPQNQMAAYVEQPYGMTNNDQYSLAYSNTPSQPVNSAGNGLPALNAMPYSQEPKREPMPQGLPLSAGTSPNGYEGHTSGYPFPSTNPASYNNSQAITANQNTYVNPDVTSPVEPRSRKRPVDQAFDTSAMQQPMQNGMRPGSQHVGQDIPYLTDGNEYADLEPYPDLGLLKYRRADGREQMKKAPSPVAD